MIMQKARKIQRKRLKWVGKQSIRARRSDCQSQKNCLEDVLGKLDESYGLKDLFQTMMNQYKDVFDDSVELKPMIGPK